MFKIIVFLCVVAAAFAYPGVLTPSLRVAAAPTLVAARPAVGLVRTAPIAVGTTIGAAPLALGGGLLTNGLVTGGLVSNGLTSGKILSGNLLSGGLVAGKIIR